MIPEDKIIKGCQAGKRKYQTQLYRQYAPKMLGVCLRYAHDRSSAEDILQDGFVKVYTYIGNFRGEGSFEGWIRRIMVNTALTWFKNQRKQGYTEDISELEDRIIMEDESDAHHNDDIEAVRPEELVELIQELPDGYRMVMNLFVFEGYAHRDISEHLGISENTSKSQLSKARRYLRRLLDERNKEKQFIPILR